MPEYDERFDPPAPIAIVTLRTTNQHKRIANVTMIIDSASDATLLPASAVMQLGLHPDPQRRYEIMAFDGGKSDAPAAACEVVFLSRAFRGIYAVLEDEIGILGRDILNHLVLVFDGPRLTWREEF
jgi:hypothetical protein